MTEQFVTANCLTCLLNQSREAEVYPEPFRMQPELMFRVSFSEYVKYVLATPLDTDVVLMSDITYLHNLASVRSPKLYSCFLADMAFAIGKEIFYAECFKRDASIIVPASVKKDSVSWDIRECSSMLSIIYACDTSLRTSLTKAGFDLPTKFSEHNQMLYQVALYLLWLCGQGYSGHEVNLVYTA